MSPKRTWAPSGLELSALTATWSPGVRSTAPRARGALVALKNVGGRAWGAANWSGTASQLISRRPPPWRPGAPPLSVPSRPRYLVTAGEMLPAPRTTLGNVARRAELPGSAAAAGMSTINASVDRAVAMRSTGESRAILFASMRPGQPGALGGCRRRWAAIRRHTHKRRLERQAPGLP